MPSVFIPNKSGHTYDDALRYGELVFVTAGTQNKYSTNQMYRVWDKVLETAKADDLIVLTGLNIICAVGAAAFAAKFGRLNLLLWRNKRYIKREIFFTEGGATPEEVVAKGGG